MLNYLFGFNTRIGRVAFVFCTLVLGFGFMMLVFGMTGNPPSSSRVDVLLAQASNNGPLLIAFYAMLAISFMLQSMRVRDIGWDPVCVMVGWIALVVIDRIVAGRFPEYALTYQHTGTAVGALTNATLMFALFFWPGERPEEAAALPSKTGDGSDGAWRPSNAPSAATNRFARVASGEFGKTK